MTRVAEIERSGLHPIKWHGFENAPEGVVPHTTMPVDALVAGLARVVGGRDLAGALFSPVLGLVFLGVCAFALWGRKFGWAGLLLAAVSPVLAHAFSIGRPDHQSLAVLLCAAALLFEAWGRRLVGAAVWALACWVTLFEPPILMALVFGGRLLAEGRRALPHGSGWWKAPAVFLAVLACGMAVDGWRGGLPGPGVRALFPGWASTIGELRPASVGTLAGWLGWAGLAAPGLLAAGALLGRDRSFLQWLLPLCGLVVLSLTAARWGYFLALVCVFSLPSAIAVIRPAALATACAILSFWPVAAEWERQIFPEGEALARVRESRKENVLLRAAAEEIARCEPGIILAPWWLSPALAYWTGFPCVAGSSHQSLPGTADSARFFLGAGEPRAILARRGVRYVVTDDPARVIPTSRAILGTAPQTTSPSPAEELARGRPQPFLEPLSANAFFRVYRVQAPPVPNPAARKN